VLSGLLGSLGLPEVHVHIHPVKVCQSVSSLFSLLSGYLCIDSVENAYQLRYVNLHTVCLETDVTTYTLRLSMNLENLAHETS
jgi:hypothetical protein